MNAILKEEQPLSNHYWMLWIAPSQSEMLKIKALPQEQQQRVLMLHPKNATQLCSALETAITSELYQSITLDRSLIPTNQHQLIEILGLKYQTHINWLNRYTSFNKAHQLSLI